MTPHSRAIRKQRQERRRLKKAEEKRKNDAKRKLEARRVAEAEILGVKQPRQVRVLTPEERRQEELKVLTFHL